MNKLFEKMRTAILQTEVDLVLLNRAPATIAWTILRSGVPLTIKNRKLYWDFMFRVSDEANAWYETSRAYYRTFEHSKSLIAGFNTRFFRLVALA